MTLGLVVYDLLFAAVALLLYGGASAAAIRFGAWAFLPALLGATALTSLLLPRLRAGRHPLLRGRVFWGWLLRSMVRRALFLAPIRPVLMSFNTLRFLTLRALGARVAFTANMSSDVDVLDPALLRVEAGATVGARCLLSGHTIQHGMLLLGEVHIGEGALLSAEVLVAPGARIGARAFIQPRASIGAGAVVGAGARVGGHAVIDNRVVVPDGAQVALAEVLREGTSAP